MTPVAGGSALSLSFGFSLLTVIILLIYIKNKDYRLFLVGQRLALGVSFFIFIATFILSYQLIISNFDIDYVADETKSSSLFFPPNVQFVIFFARKCIL